MRAPTVRCEGSHAAVSEGPVPLPRKLIGERFRGRFRLLINRCACPQRGGRRWRRRRQSGEGVGDGARSGPSDDRGAMPGQLHRGVPHRFRLESKPSDPPLNVLAEFCSGLRGSSVCWAETRAELRSSALRLPAGHLFASAKRAGGAAPAVMTCPEGGGECSCRRAVEEAKSRAP